MAWPLPILTWEMSAPVVLSSPTIQDVLGAVKLLVDASSTWQVYAGDGVTDDYLEIGPVSGAPAAYANMRAIFAGGSSAHTTASFMTATPTSVMLNFSRDVSGRTNTAADWKTGNPFAAAVDEGVGFARVTQAFTGLQELRLFLSEEGIAGTFFNSSGCAPFLFGALLDPGHSNGGDASNRRWAVAVMGSNGVWAASWHGTNAANSATTFMKNLGTTSNSPIMYIFSMSSGWDRGYADSSHVVTATLTNFSDLQDDQGYLVPSPARAVIVGTSPDRLGGFLRQIYFAIQARNGEVAQNVSLQDMFYTMSPSRSTAVDAIMLSNY